jgi:DNA-binding NtrC family response regulator
LDNVLRQAVLLSRGEVLLPGHLPARVRESPAAAPPRSVGSDHSLRGVLEATERGLMERVLADSGHSRSRAAKQLGISRVTLHRKMKQYGLIPA